MKRLSDRWPLFVALLMLAVLVVACGPLSGTPVPEVPNGPEDPNDPGGPNDPGETDDPDNPEMPEGTTGVITGKIDGELFTAYTFGMSNGNEYSNTATWLYWSESDTIDVILLGYVTNPSEFSRDIRILLKLDRELKLKPANNRFSPPYEVTYSEYETAYELETITIDVSADFVDVETLTVSGTFSGTLVNRHGGGDTKELTDGWFEIEKVSLTKEYE